MQLCNSIFYTLEVCWLHTNILWQLLCTKSEVFLYILLFSVMVVLSSTLRTEVLLKRPRILWPFQPTFIKGGYSTSSLRNFVRSVLGKGIYPYLSSAQGDDLCFVAINPISLWFEEPGKFFSVNQLSSCFVNLWNLLDWIPVSPITKQKIVYLRRYIRINF